MFFSLTAFLVFTGALLACLVLCRSEIKTKLKLISVRCALLVFLLSMIYMILSLAGCINTPRDIVNDLAVAATMNFYAWVFCAGVWVWAWAVPAKPRATDAEFAPAQRPVLRMPERYFSRDPETRTFKAVGRG